MTVPPPPPPPPPPSYSPPPQPWGQDITTWLWQSIVVTILCCLPFGIVGIVFAAQTSSRLGAGDYAGAIETSAKAKMWVKLAFFIGLPLQIIFFAIRISALK